MPGDKVNFNLYNLSGDMLAFLREDELTAEQQNNILAVLGLTTEGLEGPPGPSAYDVAVENGYLGDEISWLASLEGPQGPQGQSSTELLKPYLYNKYLDETIFPGYWTLEQWNMMSGPVGPLWQEFIIPDGIETLLVNASFIETMTPDSKGYDPLPYSLTYIGPVAGLTTPLDRSVMDNIIYTLNNCNTMLVNPASFTRTLDFSTFTYLFETTDNCFFDQNLQGAITNILNVGWSISWPYGGIPTIPFELVAIYPGINFINSFYYTQDNGTLYSAYEPFGDLNNYTVVSDINTFPITTILSSSHFTKDNNNSYYYYTPV